MKVYFDFFYLIKINLTYCLFFIYDYLSDFAKKH